MTIVARAWFSVIAGPCAQLRIKTGAIYGLFIQALEPLKYWITRFRG
jgi:hypothetical protein